MARPMHPGATSPESTSRKFSEFFRDWIGGWTGGRASQVTGVNPVVKCDTPRQSSALRIATEQLDQLKASIHILNTQAPCFCCEDMLDIANDVEYEFEVPQDSETYVVLRVRLPGYRCTRYEEDFTDKTIRETFESIVESAVNAVEDYRCVVEALGLEEEEDQYSIESHNVPHGIVEESLV